MPEKPASPENTLLGRVALITGGTRGIGLAIAAAMAKAGAHVVISGRPGPHADAALAYLEVQEAVTKLIAADLDDDLAVDSLPRRAIAAFGRIDVLVNSAGIDSAGTVFDTSLETWRRTQRINLEVPFRLCNALCKPMIERGNGAVINITSVLGLIASRNQCAYVASKHGLVGMTKAMAMEWGSAGVRVNAIAPGLIETDMSRFVWEDQEMFDRMMSRVPTGQPGNVSDVAGLAVFLASDAAAYINGQTIAVDGGRTAG